MNKNKLVRRTIYVEPELKKWLFAEAKTEGVSVSQFVARLIEMDKNGKGGAQ